MTIKSSLLVPYNTINLGFIHTDQTRVTPAIAFVTLKTFIAICLALLIQHGTITLTITLTTELKWLYYYLDQHLFRCLYPRVQGYTGVRYRYHNDFYCIVLWSIPVFTVIRYMSFSLQSVIRSVTLRWSFLPWSTDSGTVILSPR